MSMYFNVFIVLPLDNTSVHSTKLFCSSHCNFTPKSCTIIHFVQEACLMSYISFSVPSVKLSLIIHCIVVLMLHTHEIETSLAKAICFFFYSTKHQILHRTFCFNFKVVQTPQLFQLLIRLIAKHQVYIF